MTATDAVKDNLSPEFIDFFLKHSHIKRIGIPEEVAAIVVYFARDDSAYTTGQIIDVFGGFELATLIYGDMINMKYQR